MHEADGGRRFKKISKERDSYLTENNVLLIHGSCVKFTPEVRLRRLVWPPLFYNVDLTPWSRVLREKVVRAQLVTKLPSSCIETEGWLPYSRVHHWTLSQICVAHLYQFLKVHFSIILLCIPRYSHWSVPCVNLSLHSYELNACHYPWFDHYKCLVYITDYEAIRYAVCL